MLAKCGVFSSGVSDMSCCQFKLIQDALIVDTGVIPCHERTAPGLASERTLRPPFTLQWHGHASEIFAESLPSPIWKRHSRGMRMRVSTPVAV